MRFRTILFLIGASAATLPCVVLGFLQYRSTTVDIQRAEEARREISLLVSDRLERRLKSAADLLKLTADYSGQSGIEDTKKLNHFLDNVRQNFPDFLNMHIDDNSARSIAFSPEKNEKGQSNIGVDHSDRDHWQSKASGNQTSISGIVHARGASNQDIVNLTRPVFLNGRQAALAVCALDLNRLSESVLEGLPKNTYDIAIFDGKNRLLFANNPEVSFPDLKTFYSAGYTGVLNPLQPIGWSVGVFSKKLNREAILQDLIVKNFFIWLFTLAGAVGFGAAASVSVARAVDKLSGQMNAGRSLPEKGEKIRSPKELVLLQKTYGRMQVKLENARTELEKLNLSLEEEVARQVLKIKEQEATLVSVFDGMNEGFVLLSKSGSLIYVNRAAKELAKKKLDPAALSDLIMKHPNKADFKEHAGEFTFEIRVFRIQDTEPELTGVLIRDVTSQAQLEKLKDELISVVAHELKTPLSSARLSAEYIAKNSESKENRETAEDLIEDIDEMKKLIGSWLDSARLENGAYPLKPELCLLRPLIKKAVRLSGVPPERFSVEIDSEAPAAYIDSEAFIRILVNLIDNARKYSVPDRPLNVNISTAIEDKFVVLKFSDNGQGIEEKNLERIFDRFYQIKMNSTRRAGGVGFGLTIIKQLMELHGGTVSAASRLGEGTIFFLKFPAVPVSFNKENQA